MHRTRGFPRPHRRGRIETDRARRRSSAAVSPGLIAGGGLKPASASRGWAVSPGLTAGGGLKTSASPGPRARLSPGLIAGGGLKPSSSQAAVIGLAAFPPASPPGAD